MYEIFAQKSSVRYHFRYVAEFFCLLTVFYLFPKTVSAKTSTISPKERISRFMLDLFAGEYYFFSNVESYKWKEVKSMRVNAFVQEIRYLKRWAIVWIDTVSPMGRD